MRRIQSEGKVQFLGTAPNNCRLWFDYWRGRLTPTVLHILLDETMQRLLGLAKEVVAGVAVNLGMTNRERREMAHMLLREQAVEHGIQAGEWMINFALEAAIGVVFPEKLKKEDRAKA